MGELSGCGPKEKARLPLWAENAAEDVIRGPLLSSPLLSSSLLTSPLLTSPHITSPLVSFLSLCHCLSLSLSQFLSLNHLSSSLSKGNHSEAV